MERVSECECWDVLIKDVFSHLFTFNRSELTRTQTLMLILALTLTQTLTLTLNPNQTLTLTQTLTLILSGLPVEARQGSLLPSHPCRTNKTNPEQKERLSGNFIHIRPE